jgi:hypothetical protein
MEKSKRQEHQPSLADSLHPDWNLVRRMAQARSRLMSGPDRFEASLQQVPDSTPPASTEAALTSSTDSSEPRRP